jgi:hypothetical protein
MSLRGAPRVLGAQEYTSQLKNRVVAKTIDTSPQPATRRYNYVPISVAGNRANRVVKLVSDPTKSCSGGWMTTSDCCAQTVTVSGQPAELVADFLEFILKGDGGTIYACAPGVEESPCPQGTINNLSYPTNELTITFAGGDGYNLAEAIAIASNDITNSSTIGITIDGTPYPVTIDTSGTYPFALAFFSAGTLTSSSVVVVTFSPPISSLLSVGLATTSS